MLRVPICPGVRWAQGVSGSVHVRVEGLYEPGVGFSPLLLTDELWLRRPRSKPARKLSGWHRQQQRLFLTVKRLSIEGTQIVSPAVEVLAVSSPSDDLS